MVAWCACTRPAPLPPALSHPPTPLHCHPATRTGTSATTATSCCPTASSALAVPPSCSPTAAGTPGTRRVEALLRGSGMRLHAHACPCMPLPDSLAWYRACASASRHAKPLVTSPSCAHRCRSPPALPAAERAAHGTQQLILPKRLAARCPPLRHSKYELLHTVSPARLSYL